MKRNPGVEVNIDELIWAIYEKRIKKLEAELEELKHEQSKGRKQ